MELAVVDFDPAVFGGAEDIGVTLPEQNVGMLVGSSGMDGLRCNNVISGHHDRQRDVGRLEIVSTEPVKQAGLVEGMIERPAQRQRGVLAFHQRQLIKSAKRPALY